MNGLRSLRQGGEYRAPQSSPKHEVERITERKQCAVRKIAAACCMDEGSCFQFYSLAGSLESIPGKLKHQQQPCQTQDSFGRVVLNDEGETSQGDGCPRGIAHQRPELDEQGGEEAAGGPASDGLRRDHTRRRAKSNCQNKR